MNKKILDDLQEKLGQILTSSPAKDIERNIRAILTQALSKLDVATREEYEIQHLIITQLQNRITALEQRVTELERHLSEPVATNNTIPSCDAEK